MKKFFLSLVLVMGVFATAPIAEVFAICECTEDANGNMNCSGDNGTLTWSGTQDDVEGDLNIAADCVMEFDDVDLKVWGDINVLGVLDVKDGSFVAVGGYFRVGDWVNNPGTGAVGFSITGYNGDNKIVFIDETENQETGRLRIGWTDNIEIHRTVLTCRSYFTSTTDIGCQNELLHVYKANTFKIWYSSLKHAMVDHDTDSDALVFDGGGAGEGQDPTIVHNWVYSGAVHVKDITSIPNKVDVSGNKLLFEISDNSNHKHIAYALKMEDICDSTASTDAKHADSDAFPIYVSQNRIGHGRFSPLRDEGFFYREGFVFDNICNSYKVGDNSIIGTQLQGMVFKNSGTTDPPDSMAIVHNYVDCSTLLNDFTSPAPPEYGYNGILIDGMWGVETVNNHVKFHSQDAQTSPHHGACIYVHDSGYSATKRVVIEGETDLSRKTGPSKELYDCDVAIMVDNSDDTLIRWSEIQAPSPPDWDSDYRIAYGIYVDNSDGVEIQQCVIDAQQTVHFQEGSNSNFEDQLVGVFFEDSSNGVVFASQITGWGTGVYFKSTDVNGESCLPYTVDSNNITKAGFAGFITYNVSVPTSSSTSYFGCNFVQGVRFGALIKRDASHGTHFDPGMGPDDWNIFQAMQATSCATGTEYVCDMGAYAHGYTSLYNWFLAPSGASKYFNAKDGVYFPTDNQGNRLGNPYWENANGEDGCQAWDKRRAIPGNEYWVMEGGSITEPEPQ